MFWFFGCVFKQLSLGEAAAESQKFQISRSQISFMADRPQIWMYFGLNALAIHYPFF